MNINKVLILNRKKPARTNNLLLLFTPIDAGLKKSFLHLVEKSLAFVVMTESSSRH